MESGYKLDSEGVVVVFVTDAVAPYLVGGLNEFESEQPKPGRGLDAPFISCGIGTGLTIVLASVTSWPASGLTCVSGLAVGCGSSDIATIPSPHSRNHGI